MKNRRGLTLVEMVCAMLLLSLMALGIGVCTRAAYSNLLQAKSITKEAYDMMEQAELNILDVRKQIADHTVDVTNDYAKKNGTIFRGQWGRTDITLYDCSVSSVNSRHFYRYSLVVGEEKIPEMETPTVRNLNIYFDGSSFGLNDAHSTYHFSGAKILSSYSIDTPAAISKGVTTFQWYVSNKGFNIARTGKSEIDYNMNEAALPVYPNDYSIITSQGVRNETLSTLLEKYAGRHILLVATPSSGSTGKMGPMAISGSVFISGLPDIASGNLKIHFDASVGLDILDISESLSGNYEINNWSDLSGNGTSFVKTGNPMISYESFENGAFARYINFGSFGDGTIGSSVKSNEISLFTAVRARNASSAAILATNDFILKLTGVDYTSEPSGSLNSTHIPSDNKWYAVGMTIKDGVISFSINGESVETLQLNKSVVSDLSQLYLASDRVTTSDIDISELIVYDTALGGDDYKGIMDYLTDKYDIS